MNNEVASNYLRLSCFNLYKKQTNRYKISTVIDLSTLLTKNTDNLQQSSPFRILCTSSFPVPLVPQSYRTDPISNHTFTDSLNCTSPGPRFYRSAIRYRKKSLIYNLHRIHTYTYTDTHNEATK